MIELVYQPADNGMKGNQFAIAVAVADGNHVDWIVRRRETEFDPASAIRSDLSGMDDVLAW